MEDYQNTYGAVPRTDEHGNPVRPTDDFGRPVEHAGTIGEHHKEHHGVSGVLHRSGSSTSSSSEDDGHGGRRKKKGLKDKIKEKLPGSHNEQPHAPSTTTPGYTETHEKKGVMDKIKEKLPGHH
ncbi:hypothetical protein SLEP1_g12101 [Rubroshorea leprosula]|nr:hypothetical protein SLEP1_g12101 [Rubroshorea leprosula]